MRKTVISINRVLLIHHFVVPLPLEGKAKLVSTNILINPNLLIKRTTVGRYR